jgi:hypothetical protein
VVLIALLSFGASWAEQAGYTSQDPNLIPAKSNYPEQKPIMDGTSYLLYRVNRDWAKGKLTNDQANVIEERIGEVQKQMTEYKREDHKTIHSDHMTKAQIAALMSMLEKISKTIPK